MSLFRSITCEVLAELADAGPRRGFLGAMRAGVRAWLSAQYEAAQWNRDRSWLRGWVQDARLDTTQQDLFELIRISRNFERNNPLAQRFAALWEQYTVGPTGFNISPASSDPAWNRYARERYDEWSTFADISSRMHLGGLQCLAARRWFFDGRVLLLKTREIGSNRPRLQLIEAHRLGTPAEIPASSNVHNGIEVDPHTGRPMAYWIRTGFDDSEYRRIPATEVIDIQEPDRPWELRPVPVITPALLPLHDLRDLMALEMRAAKKAAAVAAVYKTRSRELPASQLTAERLRTTGRLTNGTATTEDRIRYVQQVLGAEMVALYPDEELIQPENTRPSVVQQQYWGFLIGVACAAVSMPKLLVFPESIQGTVARFDMDAANSFFRSRSAVLQAAFTRVYHYFIEQESRVDARLSQRPPDWRRVVVRPPRSVLADIGRNSAARLNELKAGAFTFTDHYAENGEDAYEQFRKRAEEARWIRELAEEFGVSPSEISEIVQAPEPAAPVPSQPDGHQAITA